MPYLLYYCFYIKNLKTLHAEISGDGLQERVSTFAAEFAVEVIEIEGPDHSSSELLRLQPLDLERKKERNKK